MRLFFAVLIPDEVVAEVGRIQQALRERVGDRGARWVRPEQFHYTVRFLGEISPDRAYQAIEAAEAATRSAEPFSMSVGSLGAFPNHQRPSTLWLGAVSGFDALMKLGESLERELAARGFKPEKRPLRAHLTLARLSSYDAESAAVRALRSVTAPPETQMDVRELWLMRSAAGPSGTAYTKVEKFALGGRVAAEE